MPDKKIHIYRPGEPREPSRLTKELFRAMAFFRETGTDRALKRLNRALKACFAADDTWRMVFCDEADSMPDCPGFRALFTEEGGKPYRIAFTADEEGDKTEGDSAAVSYSCRKLAGEKGKSAPADYRAFGQPEFMQNFMLYRADSRLYAFDLDDLIS